MHSKWQTIPHIGPKAKLCWIVDACNQHCDMHMLQTAQTVYIFGAIAIAAEGLSITECSVEF